MPYFRRRFERRPSAPPPSDSIFFAFDEHEFKCVTEFKKFFEHTDNVKSYDFDEHRRTTVHGAADCCSILADFVDGSGERVRDLIGLAFYQLIEERERNEYECLLAEFGDSSSSSIHAPYLPPPKIDVRLRNVQRFLVPLASIKSNMFGKFVSVKGSVARIGPIQPQTLSVGFECSECGCVFGCVRKDGGARGASSTIRPRCPKCNSTCVEICGDRRFVRCVDRQRIRIQEEAVVGQSAKFIDLECLGEDLMDQCCPGQKIMVSGVVKVDHGEGGVVRQSTNQNCSFNLYICVFSMEILLPASATLFDGGDDDAFSLDELYAIRELSQRPDIYSLLSSSLSPTIYGHETMKSGLLLALFGAGDSCNNYGRGDIHVLLLGDPGMGKSKLLESCCGAAERAVFVAGNASSSSSGLTVSVSRNEYGEQCLDAGALVLADSGLCLIDEFDKMNVAQQHSLLEAMEQQSVTVAKAGLVCSLSSRTTVIAAANPTLALKPALLARFDLVFAINDRPDPEHDSRVSEYIMRKRGGRAAESPTSSFSLSTDEPTTLPSNLLNRYIAYARRFVNVRTLTQTAAINVIEPYFLNKRKTSQISIRELESIVRLTKARARVNLREIANEHDARDAIEIFEYALASRTVTNLPAPNIPKPSGSKQAKKFMELIQRHGSNSVSLEDLREIAETGCALDPMSASNLIQKLNEAGYLIKKAGNMFGVVRF